TDALHIKAIEIIAGALRGSVAGDKDAGEEMALGQDVAVGWLQKYRNEAPARVMSKVTDEEGHTTSEV
ncbi:P2 family phage major capsid protein, partial [Escherichia coli]|uniref:P2 family phage major capsid protein n=1 Tax=Escherichia coli TaxID=562 RepID=UPI003EDF0482